MSRLHFCFILYTRGGLNITTTAVCAIKPCGPQDEAPDQSTVQQVQVDQISEEHKVGLHSDAKPPWKSTTTKKQDQKGAKKKHRSSKFLLPWILWSVCFQGNKLAPASLMWAQTLFLLMLWLRLHDSQKPILLIWIFLLSLINSKCIFLHPELLLSEIPSTAGIRPELQRPLQLQDSHWSLFRKWFLTALN